MQKNFPKLIAIGQAVASLALPFLALAQQNIRPPITSLTTGVQFVCIAVNWLFTFLIVLAIIFVIVAGFKYLTAGGDPEKIKGASHSLIYAAVAIAVAIVAKGIPLIVGSFFATRFEGC